MGKIRIFIGAGWFKNGCELFHYIARKAATGRQRYPGKPELAPLVLRSVG